MRYKLIAHPAAAADVKLIIECLRRDPKNSKQRLNQLSVDLDAIEAFLLERPCSAQQLSPGLFRIPLVSSHLNLYYRVHVREVTVAAIVAESGGQDVHTNYYEWPKSIQDSMPRTDAVERLSA